MRNFRVHSTENSAKAVPASSNGSPDFEKLDSRDKTLENGPSVDSLSQSECSLIVSNESSVKMNNSKSKHDNSIEQFDIHGTDGCINETKSNVKISNQVPEDNANLISQDAPSVGLVQDMVNNLTLQESCNKDVQSKYNTSIVTPVINTFYSDKILFLTNISNSGSETMSNASEFSSVADPPCNSIDVPENTGISSLGVATKPPSSCQSSHSLEESLESSGKLLSSLALDEKSCTSISYDSSVCSASCESTNSNFQFDEKIESLSLKKELEGTKEGERAGEDNLTFLSELHHGSSFPSHSYQFKELDQSAKEITSLDSHESVSLENENSDDTPSLNGEESTLEKLKYDRSAWTPAEIETATGSPDCTVMEHALKLQSVYGEIQVDFRCLAS